MEDASTLEPVPAMLVTELETLKVISDALRSRILDRLRATPLTVKQLAGELGVPPKKLYYHVNMMEQHGVIRVVRTRVVSGIIEKQYRATAYVFKFDQSIYASEDAGLSSLPPGLGLLFDSTRNQLAQSFEEGLIANEHGPMHRQLLGSWALARIMPEQATEFYTRLNALIDEFEQSVSQEADAEFYRLFVTLFPIRHYAEAFTAPDGDSPRDAP